MSGPAPRAVSASGPGPAAGALSAAVLVDGEAPDGPSAGRAAGAEWSGAGSETGACDLVGLACRSGAGWDSGLAAGAGSPA
jgi:hypothetical protein